MGEELTADVIRQEMMLDLEPWQKRLMLEYRKMEDEKLRVQMNEQYAEHERLMAEEAERLALREQLAKEQG